MYSAFPKLEPDAPPLAGPKTRLPAIYTFVHVALLFSLSKMDWICSAFFGVYTESLQVLKVVFRICVRILLANMKTCMIVHLDKRFGWNALKSRSYAANFRVLQAKPFLSRKGSCSNERTLVKA